jgi:type I restriction enzyme S subunit
MTDTLLKRVIKIIPEDWERVKIGDIGSTYGGLTNKSKKDFGEGKPYIPFMNIMNNAKIDLDYFDYVNIQEGENQNRALEGDLFFNTSSETPEEVGMCAVLDKNILELYLNSFCFGFRLKDQDSLNPLFVSYFFRSDFGRKVMFPLAQGMTRYNLSKRYFLQLEIPKPKIEEQNKIIDILSTVDESLEKTATIIEETRQLKKGLMQKLFTEGIGHTRFKETKIGKIPEQWETKLIGDFATKFKGGASLRPSDFVNSGTKVLPKLGVVPGGLLYIPKEKQQYCSNEYAETNKNALVETNYLIVVLRDLVPSGPSIGLIVRIPDREKYILAQGVYGLTIDTNQLDRDYLIQLSNSTWYRKYMQRIMVGSTQVHIRNKEFLKVVIPYPNIDEQRQIAQILSEVDAKIEKEEATKAELEQLKKGLMQVLLTGQIRVKVKA